jgi:DNA-directed RNA polymerase
MKAVKGMMVIGKGIETEYLAETIKSVSGVDSPQWLRTIDPATQKPTERSVANTWRNIGENLDTERNAGQWGDIWTPNWSMHTHIDVGGFLLTLLIETAKVTRTLNHPVTGEEV